MPKTKTVGKQTDYRGMEGVLRKKQREAVDGLIALLVEVTGWHGDPQKVINVYGGYTRCLDADAKKPKAFDLYRIGEIAFVYGPPGEPGSGGSSYMAGTPDCMGLIAACEKYLEEFHTKPYRPRGWESDIDEKADAEWRLRKLWDDLETPEQTEDPDAEPPVEAP